MRVHLKMDSTGLAYLPGLAKGVTLESDALSPEDAAELEQRVQAANFFDLPPAAAAPRGAADLRQQTITVEDAGRVHTVRMSDLTQNVELRALVDWVREKARGQG